MMFTAQGRRRLLVVAAMLAAVAVPCAAQTLPSEPIVLAEGRVTIGGNVSATIAPEDTGYFNYTDYEHSAVRMLQLDFTGSVRLTDHFSVLTDIRSAYAGYQTAEQVLSLYESGYLDQADQSRDISNYAFQRGAASLLDMLDAERSYRATQLAYRQALAAYMTSTEQINFVVGKKVTP